MITKLIPEQHTEDEVSSWILEDPMTTLKTEIQNASTATSMNIWQKNAGQRRRNEKLRSVSNVTRKDTSPRTVKKSRQ